MSSKRQYKLNMPQLLWGGLSENWLLKELGDMHWQQITSALNTPSDQLTDSRGERLYASFVRLHWSGANISNFVENHSLELNSSLSRYGSKMFFSETFGEGESGKFKANLMSVFSTREKSDNTKLKKGTLKAEIDSDAVHLHEKLPPVAKEYLENKGEIFDKDSTLLPQAVLEFIYQKEYIIDAYDDINGVGLLYFASYPKINDKCEREYIKSTYELSGDWLEIAGVTSRDIHYYGNANSGDKLIYELNVLEKKEDQIQLHSSIYRAKDQQLIARIYTTKQLQPDAIFKKLEDVITQQEDLKKEIPTKAEIHTVKSTKSLTDLDQDTLNTIVITFLKSVLGVTEISKDTPLKDLRVESIMYQELSEHLFEKYEIDSNPSRFYGASSINALTDYLLGKDTTSVSRKYFDSSLEEEVAVVGISCQFPGASNKEMYWEQLKNNEDLITEVTEDRWDWKSFNKDPEKTQKSKWGGFIEGVGNFDPLFFGISPFEAELMDPQQRLTLEAVYTALEDANIVPSTLKGSNTGVYIGVSGSDYAHITREARKETVQAYDAIGTANSILANRISYLLDIHGPNQAIDTACSSSLVAVNQAVKSIQSGVSDMAIAGGVHIMLRPELTISYQEAGMLSVDGKCKTFDDTANGYVRGEGVGIIVLKSLKKAKEDGDYIYGVIKGSAVNHGGNANTLTAPNPQAQKDLLVEAYKMANVHPAEVSYIEAHGTGTPLGDPIEIEGLKLAFEELNEGETSKKPAINYCGIGSVKTNIGHLEAAAGIAGLIKVLLCMQNKTLPGNPNLKVQNKYIDIANSPFYLRNETSVWEVENEKRIAGVSSFGFGGVNAHVIVEGFKNKAKVYKSLDDALILLSAKNTERLKEKASSLKELLQYNEKINLHDLACTLQYGREAMEERLAFKARNISDVISKLEAYEAGNVLEVATGNTKKENCDFLLEGIAGKTYMDIIISHKEYHLLAQLWVRGVDLDWSFLYGKTTPNKIALPTYPFAKQFYWVSKTEKTTEHLTNAAVEVEETTLIVEEEATVTKKVETFLMSLLQKVLKLEEKDIDLSADIADYGIDSIMSNIMISDIKELVLDVSPLLFLEHKTFDDIVNQLVEEFSDSFSKFKQNKPSTTHKKPVIVEKEKDTEVKEEVAVITENKSKTNDLAIVGINSMLPQTEALHQFFNHIKNRNVVTEKYPQKRKELLDLNEKEEDKLENFTGAFIDNIEYFDFKRFKFSEEEAIQIDPQLRKLIESVWYAIGDSGYTVKDFNKKETGVFVSTKGNSGYLGVMQKNDLNYEIESSALYANRLSHVFNLKGPSEVIDTACSSFIVALQRASHAFQRGDCSQAIVATATINLSFQDLTKEDLTGIYSQNGNTKSFSEDADGFVRSEAIGTMVVKPLEQAEKDGDYIYGVVKGIGVYHGGKSPLKWNSPNIKGLKKTIEKSIEAANIDPATIDYIEAEANGVSFVDTSEIVAMQNVYGSYLTNTSDKTFYVGSLKPLMGHAEASSTFPCILKLLASIKTEKLYGVKGLEEINKAITLNKNFEILKQDIDWTVTSDHPKRAAVNCLGIGGVNTHLILEEYSNTVSAAKQKEKNFVFIFSDVDAIQLNIQLQQVLNSLKGFDYSLPELELLNRLEYTLQEGRLYEKCRLAFIASKLEDVITNIENCILDNNHWSNEINRFYNLDIATPTKEVIEAAITDKNWKSLAEFWVTGTTIHWDKTRISSNPKRLPVPTTTLKRSYCWPHKIISYKENEALQLSKTSTNMPSLYNLINGQVKSPYKIENNHLFLFNLKWKPSFVNDALVETDIAKHTILCYLENTLPENYAGLVLEKPHVFNEKTFTKLINNTFLYIKDIIKQKPKNKVVIQIVLPISSIHNCYGLSGMIHTVRQESTKIKAQLIFVEETISQDALQNVLEENLVKLEEDRIIKYERRMRLVEYVNPTHVMKAPISYSETYKKDDVVIITGGLGGLGIVCAEDIIENCPKATIILVGRSSLNNTKQELLDKLNKGEHEVVYFQADISEEKEVESLIKNTIKYYKKLDGIIHCAGVIRDSYMMKKTTEELEAVFKPKVNGAYYLDKFTENIELSFFLCFSSLHSLGNPGQVDYAMSNAYLDGFVRERNELVLKGKRSGKSIAMNWPYWESGGMQLSETAIDLMALTKGSVPMPTKMGMEIMHYAIQIGLDQLFVDMGNYEKIIKQYNIQLEEASMAL